MIDASTRKPLLVSAGGDAGPYIIVPMRQVEDVRALLRANDVAHWVDEDTISFDGGPAVTVVNLESSSDCLSVQRILDNASKR